MTAHDAAGRRPRSATPWQLFCWAMYDWATSAYPTVVQTFLFAAYFANAVATDKEVGTAQWGMAIGVAGVIVALGGPLMGAMTDQTGRRKSWILLFTLITIAASAGWWWVYPAAGNTWLALMLIAVGTIAFEFASIFYNAMLPDLASEEKTGRWSGWAFGLGYAGGLVCLAAALVLFVQPGSDRAKLADARAVEIAAAEAAGQPVPEEIVKDRTAQHVRATAFLVAVWQLVFVVPFFLFTPDTPSTGRTLREAVPLAAAQLWQSVRNVGRYRSIVLFLIARMIYVDGLATLFAFGGIFASGTFNMTESDILKFGIALNVTAGLGAFAFGWIDDYIGSKRTILISLVCLIITGSIVLSAESVSAFWIACLTLGIFIGPTQAASRSLLSRLAPPELTNQVFGLYALSGKATSFVGPSLVAWVTYATSSQRLGMTPVILLWGIGLLLMLTVPSDSRKSGPLASAGTGESSI